MNDMTATTIAKSDQLNADDLIGTTKTITITSVSINPGAEQPVSISFEGDNKKPYKPGKSMRRVLVNFWGPDANVYVGRRLTLYRDEEVAFGGLKVGGIRISHMSDIKAKASMALTATRGKKNAFTVEPLQAEKPRTVNAYIREKLGECTKRAEVADLAGRDPLFLEHGEKAAVKDLVKARMDSLPPDEDEGAEGARSEADGADADDGEITV